MKSGALSRDALFYVPCRQEPVRDDLDAKDSSESKSFSAHSASDVKERWDPLLSGGAEFITSDDKLDNLYKTSLINIFLLRTKYSGIATGGTDLYVVKPGATSYDAFWYRDGAYMVTALEVAGLPREAEKSLRLFWESGLPGVFAALGQQQNGAWQAPAYEYDSQGQTLWALCRHRNAFVFEDEGILHLCWGAKPAWLKKGIHVKDAPTDFGSISLDFKMSNGELSLDYRFLPKAKGAAVKEILLRIPPTVSTRAIRVNGKVCTLGPSERAIRLE